MNIRYVHENKTYTYSDMERLFPEYMYQINVSVSMCDIYGECVSSIMYDIIPAGLEGLASNEYQLEMRYDIIEINN